MKGKKAPRQQKPPVNHEETQSQGTNLVTKYAIFIVLAIVVLIIVSLSMCWFVGRERTSDITAGLFSPTYKYATTTVFWVGERPDDANGHISNVPSAWDEHWEKHYGGVDTPHDRCAFLPCAFVPKENPYYAALPYNDWDENGDRKKNAQEIPWYKKGFPEAQSLMKNQWIEIKRDTYTCYAQIEDVGPFEEDDFSYVFGKAPHPINTLGLKAGLDVSPAVRDCLHFRDGSAQTKWRFVKEKDVPFGYWSIFVTKS